MILSNRREPMLTPRLRRAMVSPLGVGAAVVGGGVAAIVGLPFVGVVGVGVAAWGVRVGTAVGRGPLASVDPRHLDEPWRGFVERATRSRQRYVDATRTAARGPLRDQLGETTAQFTLGVHECWRAAQGGQALSDAAGAIDKHRIQTQLTRLNWGPQGVPAPGTAKDRAREALESQLGSVERLEGVIADTESQLTLLGARLEQAVTAAIELSVRRRVGPHDHLGESVQAVVADMEALRIALDEIDGVASGEVHRLAIETGRSPGASPPPTSR